VTPFIQIVTRDVRLAFRQGGATMLVVVFFVLTVTLFPLGVGPESAVLRRIAPGVIWVAALLAAMLSLDRLFQVDFEDGSLDQLALAPLPLELVAAAKCIAHWLSTGLPLLVISPLLGVLLNLNGEAYGTLLMAMAVGTPSLSLVGAIGAALTVGIRRGGVLLSLLVLPLYIPILIFGVGAIDAAVDGLGGSAHLFVLAAILAAALPLAPWAIAGALRLNLE
jgi:heme exporter protein B